MDSGTAERSNIFPVSGAGPDGAGANRRPLSCSVASVPDELGEGGQGPGLVAEAGHGVSCLGDEAARLAARRLDAHHGRATRLALLGVLACSLAPLLGGRLAR